MSLRHGALLLVAARTKPARARRSRRAGARGAPAIDRRRISTVSPQVANGGVADASSGTTARAGLATATATTPSRRSESRRRSGWCTNTSAAARAQTAKSTTRSSSSSTTSRRSERRSRCSCGADSARQRCGRSSIVAISCARTANRRRTASRVGWRRLDLDRPVRPWRSKSQERNVRHVVDALVASGCVDCGERDPCVLEFDHVGEKTTGVMQLARREVSVARLDAEIARCEVRCVNCHRRRTSVAGGHYRARTAIPPGRVELPLTG